MKKGENDLKDVIGKLNETVSELKETVAKQARRLKETSIYRDRAEIIPTPTQQG